MVKAKHHGQYKQYKHKHMVKDDSLSLLVLLTDHLNGALVLFIRKAVVICYFNPEMKRTFVLRLEGIDLQRTVPPPHVSHQLRPTPEPLRNFRLDWVVDEMVCLVEPHPRELSGLVLWLWEGE